MLRDQYLPLILENRVSVEIGVDAEVLDTCPAADLKKIADTLIRADLHCSLHAPFLDLSLGAIDPKIRRVSVERMEQVIRLIPIFQPRWVVGHGGYEARHYQDQREDWLKNNIESLQRLLSLLEGTGVPLMLENVYEKEPDHLKALLDALPLRRAAFLPGCGPSSSLRPDRSERLARGPGTPPGYAPSP